MTQPQPKKSDLGVRTASALVMVAVAGTALWLGGAVWTVFVAVVALGVLWEWSSLAFALTIGGLGRLAWVASGLLYIAVAAAMLIFLRAPFDGVFQVGVVMSAVIGVDVGAYIAGRSIGGPKIAPSISPSKTWAGLFGGVIGAALIIALASWAWPAGLCSALVPDLPPSNGRFWFDDRCHLAVPPISWLMFSSAIVGALVAVVSQAGDFFESWMKRRAGVKDSGTLIPGHGGLFDRVDGLLAVTFVLGMAKLVFRLHI